jgi:lipopolysaccharide transport system ATP-binding protein
MTAKPIITVENLSKSYVIGHDRAAGGLYRYRTLRDSLGHAGRGAWRMLRQPLKLRAGPAETEVFWAVKNVSFEIQAGEKVGIIGRNGAGKSTLLKLLSRITTPTQGRITLRGRVASLLEVGTGFHPELTGRENIFLNGAILGMRQAEIRRKFDAIVAFAEVERFLDTPVKRYSSGMYVRLAFAVAAHLEPEILLIDEVLAVGDAAFQRKCLGKMEDASKEGRTIFFVSHNMAAVQKLCERCILLDQGEAVRDGEPASVIAGYLNDQQEAGGEACWDFRKAPGDDMARLRSVRVLDQFGKVCTRHDVRDAVAIELCYWVLADLGRLDVSLYLSNDRNERVLVSMEDSNDAPAGGRSFKKGLHRSLCHIPGDFLDEGRLFVQVALTDSIVHTIQRDVVSFTISDEMRPGGARGNYFEDWPAAAVRPRLSWSLSTREIDMDRGGDVP